MRDTEEYLYVANGGEPFHVAGKHAFSCNHVRLHSSYFHKIYCKVLII